MSFLLLWYCCAVRNSSTCMREITLSGIRSSGEVWWTCSIHDRRVNTNQFFWESELSHVNYFPTADQLHRSRLPQLCGCFVLTTARGLTTPLYLISPTSLSNINISPVRHHTAWTIHVALSVSRDVTPLPMPFVNLLNLGIMDNRSSDANCSRHDD